MRGAAVIASLAAALLCEPETAAAPGILFGRSVRLDRGGDLLSWSTEGSSLTLASHVLPGMPSRRSFLPQDNGLETWLAYSRFDPDTFEGIAWPHNPASLFAMLTDSACSVVRVPQETAPPFELARKALDLPARARDDPVGLGMGRVDFASADAGDVEYRGRRRYLVRFLRARRRARGDRAGQVGELGFAYLQMFELTGDARFPRRRDGLRRRPGQARCAGDRPSLAVALPGYARTNVVREEYSANLWGRSCSSTCSSASRSATWPAARAPARWPARNGSCACR